MIARFRVKLQIATITETSQPRLHPEISIITRSINIAMSTQTLTQASEVEQLRLKASKNPVNDWQADLIRDGYAVVKGAVAKEKAAKYAERMYQYLEGL